ncbi:MAG: UDP-N-acetylmuramate dehydrogenase [Acidimicrobiia bacterium]
MTIDHIEVRTDVDLAPMTTYKVGGRASLFAEPHDLETLRSILAATPAGIEIVTIGRGSNVVISDDGIDGLVIRLGASFSAIEIRDDGTVVAGGAVLLPRLARAAAARGRAGLGFYLGIPGSVGGAVRMNAGGHGSDTVAVLRSVVLVDTRTGEARNRTAGELALGYRSSNLDDTDIVVQATFATTDGDVGTLDRELRDITRWRRNHQPSGALNAGSVFKNPPQGSPAGQLIDMLGLKGTRVGPVRISEIHANFMIAEPGAKAMDIWRFVHTIRSIVQERTGTELEPEIRFLGVFEERTPS